jgi:hypothetical protein
LGDLRYEWGDKGDVNMLLWLERRQVTLVPETTSWEVITSISTL